MSLSHTTPALERGLGELSLVRRCCLRMRLPDSEPSPPSAADYGNGFRVAQHQFLKEQVSAAFWAEMGRKSILSLSLAQMPRLHI